MNPFTYILVTLPQPKQKYEITDVLTSQLPLSTLQTEMIDYLPIGGFR